MIIRIASLSDGENRWHDVISPDVVDLDRSRFKSQIMVELFADMRSGRILIEVFVETEQAVICDRCCENFVSTVHGKCKVIFTQREFIDPEEDPGDDFRCYLLGQDELDVTPEVRDALLLSIPFRNICSDNCRGLCTKCGANLNLCKCVCVQEFQEVQ